MAELVLRGIFLIRKKEIDWFYQVSSVRQNVNTQVNAKYVMYAYHRDLERVFCFLKTGLLTKKQSQKMREVVICSCSYCYFNNIFFESSLPRHPS